MFFKKYGWSILYGILLLGFTVYVLLDTFVIARPYSAIPYEGKKDLASGMSMPESAASMQEREVLADTAEASTEAPTDEEERFSPPAISDDTYSDDNITIRLIEYREYDTSIYVADIQLSSAQYLKTALAGNIYGKNVTAETSKTAGENGAILAINGDHYGAREAGYVLRNGVVYRDVAARNQEDLVIYGDGSFSIVTEGEVSAETLLENGAEQILAFGPALVAESRIAVTEGEEVGRAKASNPRTAIGRIDALHYLFVVSDGRTEESKGLTLYELAAFMQSLGAATAYNLDGGGSSTMYFNGKVVNNPTTNGRSIQERSVSDIVYIGY
ncbi:MAG: phosphodiester glycosidase family protein [Clostridiales bacterium]|nr:phosphodiester glycosidase family protein [Clostridiales bacterium]